jgi:tetrahydromethanopterin S-methyltransferase subunit G
MRPEEVEGRFERIERSLEFLASNQAQLSADLIALTGRVDGIAAQVGRVSGEVTAVVDAVSSLVKLFERHIGDGHGGR